MIHNRNTYIKKHCRCTECVRDNSEYKKSLKIKNGGDLDIKLDVTPLLMRLARDGMMSHINHHSKARWIKNGISVYRADEVCIKLGYHPNAIWGAAFYEGCTGNIDF